MPDTTIHLALTDDWELRGNGSGRIAQIQFHPMKELRRIYESYGVRSTFNVEVMQQLAFRKFQDKHKELKPLADEWDDHVREAFRHGQDIQLHVHPQWSKVQYKNGRWILSGDWALPNYDQDTAYSMLAESKTYLEELLHPLDPAYRCVAFRAGASIIAPSKFALSLLVKLGIVFDMSIVGGLSVNTRNLRFDYTDCEESFLPFYPLMEDARRVSDKTEPIICVPIFHFTLSRRQSFRQTVLKAVRQAGQKSSRGAKENEGKTDYANQEWAEVGRSSRLARVYDKAIRPSLAGKYMVADISQLDYAGLKEMIAAIRLRARATKLSCVPVILTNHSKYIKDFFDIERFIAEISKAVDIKFATLTELAERLQAGEYPVRKA
ncbi:MAG: hypothetical protein DMF68_16555 [Acidobacteria bacterium]|nr:MAG: hypothetical protein DMF68_16555 [Acidobacteriota bacterium]